MVAVRRCLLTLLRGAAEVRQVENRRDGNVRNYNQNKSTAKYQWNVNERLITNVIFPSLQSRDMFSLSLVDVASD